MTEILLEDLVPLFEYRLIDAANKLGVSTSKLRCVCRKLGIPRWPYRKISSLHRKYQMKKDPKFLKRIEEIKANPSCLVKNWSGKTRTIRKIRSLVEFEELLNHNFSGETTTRVGRLPSFRELCNMLKKHHILSE